MVDEYGAMVEEVFEGKTKDSAPVSLCQQQSHIKSPVGEPELLGIKQASAAVRPVKSNSTDNIIC